MYGSSGAHLWAIIMERGSPRRSPRHSPQARVINAYSGADFEGGRVGHRNGPAIAGQEHDRTDGTAPEDDGRRGLAGTGLAKEGQVKVRKPAAKMPMRKGPVWATVRVIGRHYETTPQLECIDCGVQFSGGLTRVEDHIVGKCAAEKACKCSTDVLMALRNTIVAQRKLKDQAGAQKRAAETVQANAEEVLPAKKQTQRSIESSLQLGTAETLDNKIAELVYGDNLPHSIVESPRFKAVIEAAKVAPGTYVPPSRRRIGGQLLDSTTSRLKAEEKPLRDSCTVHGKTVISDGWDDVDRSHLINFLVATTKGCFFDGTVMLSSDDHEDAKAVAKLIEKEIEHVGALTVVHVVTDTCAVMKAAWKIIEEKYPWITCTCCAPHVLSLLLHDIGKIPEVARVISKVKKVLNRFWGRKRWCRNKLREVVLKNHKKKLGLYRAAATRFAGTVREMGRMLRLKADLKYIVDLPEYSAQDFRKKRGADGDDDEDLDGEGGVRAILLDEDGFWAPMLDALKVPHPTRHTAHMAPHGPCNHHRHRHYNPRHQG